MAKAKNTRRRVGNTREAVLQRLASQPNTSKWLSSDNPIKRRIAVLEVAWRDAVQWLAEDVQKMFSNLQLIADAHTELDLNLATLRSLLEDKGVTTDAEFTERKAAILDLYTKMQEKTGEDLNDDDLPEEGPEEATLADEDEAADGSSVSPELVKMRKAAKSASGYVPPEAYIFGG